MADLLIRDVPDDVVAAIDAKAKKVGVSRAEYVRRTPARETVAGDEAVSVADLTRFADTFADLTDDDVMRQAWS